MAKMKYWDGIKWVVLDAAGADTVEGKTVAQIRSDRASKAEFDAHRADYANYSRWGAL